MHALLPALYFRRLGGTLAFTSAQDLGNPVRPLSSGLTSSQPHRAVADIIRTTLGPRSMLKMLLDAQGGEWWGVCSIFEGARARFVALRF